MNIWTKIRLSAIALGFGLAVPSAPANACVELVQGGCAMQAKHEQLVRDDNNYEGYLRSIEGDVTYGSPAPTIPRHRSSKYADRKNLSTEWERVVNSHAPLIERIEVR